MIPLHDDNPTTLTPVVTISFIVLCAVVFLWQIMHDAVGQQQIAYSLGAIPAVLLEGARLPPELERVPPNATLITSMFLHGGWMHLIGNMLYLWIFGNNIEDAMGHVRFVFFYVLCGIAAVYSHAIPNMGSEVPMIGASGAISGVLGAYLLLFPNARVLIAVPIFYIIQTFRVSAMVVLVFWFVMQLVTSLLVDSSAGGVAFGAHIGGFIAGLILIPVFKYRRFPLRNPFAQG